MIHDKKHFEQIKIEIYKLIPELSTVFQTEIIEEELFGEYRLLINHKNRGCEIYYFGSENIPRCVFKWDNTEIFEVSNFELDRLCFVITKWVVNNEMPSRLKKEFPDVFFGKLSEYYENGNGVEGEFILSWDLIESHNQGFFDHINAKVLKLIQQIRERGFDKTLRAGNVLQTLIFSRSRRNGLREDHKTVVFYFPRFKMIVLNKKGEKFEFDKIEYNEVIEKLLKELEQEEID